jgi:hypothetical protein
MLTDWTSKLTHFNSIIRLSIVKQLALPFTIILRPLADPAVLVTPWILHLFQIEFALNSQNFRFYSLLKPLLPHTTRRMLQAGPCFSGMVSFLLMVLW